jgi:hypothetical protein
MKQAEINKQLTAIAKAAAKRQGWKSVGGMPYWSIGPLFFQLVLGAVAKEGTFYCTLRFKWLELDNELWRVLDMSSNENEPFSLHANGAFVLTGQELFSISKRSLEWLPGVLEQQINEAVALGHSRSNQVAEEVGGIDSYLDFIGRQHKQIMEKYPFAVVDIWKERLLAALLVGDFASSEKIAKERILAGDHGGHSTRGKSFYECALALCDAKRISSISDLVE